MKALVSDGTLAVIAPPPPRRRPHVKLSRVLAVRASLYFLMHLQLSTLQQA